jgi:hypothetical protein
MKGFCVIKEIKIVRVERFPASAFQASDFALGASLSATTQQVELRRTGGRAGSSDAGLKNLPALEGGQFNHKRNFADSYYPLSIVRAVFNRDLCGLAYTHICCLIRKTLKKRISNIEY